ncbi:2-oxoglutarate dehydrogenase E1 component [Algisphaera agarilytica]|uniref:2-oxoglutarate dehydrogenase E1 component n=1 Tax=Algisphaera agarilytica TaxID=1385975 RepID=A0A7X0LJE8_9BACT|nr:2-oxoglutarate dehydrogenase E1 component [Algisphaera agarilytica]MBB6429270.1 2-oxoglutarate dehydrogenase E1 component [Algisphaera agarilytica]
MVEPDHSFPDSANLAYVEAMYNDYLDDPTSVDASWHQLFSQWGMNTGRRVGTSLKPRGLFDVGGAPATNGHATTNGHAHTNGKAPTPSQHPAAGDASSLQHRVDMLVRNYRVRGHIAAHLNPLAASTEVPDELQPGYYGFTEADYDRPFSFTSTVPGDKVRTLRDIIDQMTHTYCGSVAAQFMHIDDLEVRQWLQRRMESTENTVKLTRKEQIRILTRLTDAVIFEEFIQRKFIGAKSFSLEGGESLIPLLDLAFEKAGEQGTKEIVIGMAHRGRLNVLANILGKSPQRIFREFEDADPMLHIGGGDVKYHMGYSGDWRTRGGKNIHLSLCFNPSHLEYVGPVALGRLRAKQDRAQAPTRGEVGLGLLIHGDAAFAGEGVVQETLNLSQLEGYHTGGTVHVIVNNQIGFTTAPRDSRSMRYCTDIGKMLQVPIFHVNGEDPEAVAQVVQLAMEFRFEFKRDVIIDMYCYRRRGHNEGDEPSYTQPKMYKQIDQRQTVRLAYLERLKQLGGVSDDDAKRIATRRTELLEKELTAARSDDFKQPTAKPKGLWQGYTGGLEKDAHDPDLGVDLVSLKEMLHKQTQLPEDFNLHPKLKRLLRLKNEIVDGKRPLDWAAAESLAFASLCVQGHRVRISGQDSQRGTFSHRHAVLHDVKDDGTTYTPLQHLSEDQAPIDIINSPLSEAGVLGFDYGYSLDYPCGLTIWEAQFGDFVNCAQVIIDQFISSAEDKWKRLSGIVMLLPHGMEGQGPEHSSARLERFLNQCAEDNIQVAEPSTPAQMFRLLRRQVVRKWRKPLIVMTPKSLLRNPRCVSAWEDLAPGTDDKPNVYQRVIGDPDVGPDKAKKLLLCSGKIYYDLIARREKLERDDVAILRLEQYYPFPVTELTAALEPYGDDMVVHWVQEEPRNMGAWQFLKGGYGHELLHRWHMERITRPPSASPATGSKAAHAVEQEEILQEAFKL